MSIKHMNTFQKPLSIILLFSFLFVFSCSVEDSVTNSNDQVVLEKPFEIEAPASDNPWDTFVETLGEDAIRTMTYGVFLIILAQTGKVIGSGPCFQGLTESNGETNKIAYDFRDKYLLKSEKGEIYTIGYYLLSHYGIENDLVMRYPLEHLSIMETGIEISKGLQHNNNDDRVLINKSTYNDLKNLVAIYRNAENKLNLDITPVLNYLETDLEKYYNKPKAEIAADFGF